MDRILRDKRAIALFVLPGLIAFVIMVFLPIVMAFVFSLYKGMLGFDFKFVGFANYPKLFKDISLGKVMGNTFYYFFIVTPADMVLSIVIALIIMFYTKGWANTLARVIVFLPVVLPSIGVAELFRKILEVSPYPGLLNTLLATFGLANLARPWLGDMHTIMTTISVIDIWRGMGFYVVILYAGLTSVPEEILESARIDGAKRLAQVRYIILPMIKPVIITCLVLSVNYSLKVFDTPFMLTAGGPGDASTVLPLYTYKTAFAFSDYGFGSVLAMFLLAQCVVISLVINRLNKDNT